MRSPEPVNGYSKTKPVLTALRFKQCIIGKLRYIVRALRREVEKEKFVERHRMLKAGIHCGDNVSA